MGDSEDRYGQEDADGHFYMPFQDKYRPPSQPIEVRCTHCGEVFESSKMWWMELQVLDGKSCGCWKCPTTDCLGCDFGEAIHPTDPAYIDEYDRDVVWRDEDGHPARPKTWREEMAEAPHEPRTAENDPFRPPSHNTEVLCIHCREKYDSYRMEWREMAGKDGTMEGFWCCPIAGCDGKGFGCDIFPTDVNYPEMEDGRMVGGWFDDDGNRMPPPGA